MAQQRDPQARHARGQPHLHRLPPEQLARHVAQGAAVCRPGRVQGDRPRAARPHRGLVGPAACAGQVQAPGQGHRHRRGCRAGGRARRRRRDRLQPRRPQRGNPAAIDRLCPGSGGRGARPGAGVRRRRHPPRHRRVQGAGPRGHRRWHRPPAGVGTGRIRSARSGGGNRHPQPRARRDHAPGGDARPRRASRINTCCVPRAAPHSRQVRRSPAFLSRPRSAHSTP